MNPGTRWAMIGARNAPDPMKLLLDFLPVLLFFAVYKFHGALPAGLTQQAEYWLPGGPSAAAGAAILLATAVAIVASFVQVGITYALRRRVETMHLISLGLITVFGGATLLLHDPVFIKWKPTILNWLFAGVFLASQWFTQRPLAERLMGEALRVPAPVWQRVNLAWAGFFVLSGAANLFVAYRYSEKTWVSFKLFGLFGMTIAFIVLQALYLARHMEAEPPPREDNA